MNDKGNVVMEEKVIKTKFTVASEEGIDRYQHLAIQSTWEKYRGLATDEDIDSYIYRQFKRERIVIELNTFSNQLIVVYVDDVPAGYAFLKGIGHTSGFLENKRSICIAEFEILEEYLASKAKVILLEKCLSICKSYDAIWLYQQDSQYEIKKLFADYGFYSPETEDVRNSCFGLVSTFFIKINEQAKT